MMPEMMLFLQYNQNNYEDKHLIVLIGMHFFEHLIFKLKM